MGKSALLKNKKTLILVDLVNQLILIWKSKCQRAGGRSFALINVFLENTY